MAAGQQSFFFFKESPRNSLTIDTFWTMFSILHTYGDSVRHTPGRPEMLSDASYESLWLVPKHEMKEVLSVMPRQGPTAKFGIKYVYKYSCCV